MTTITVPKNYGYVLGISLVATPLLAFTHGMITGRKRKAAKIPYPNAYATAEQMKANPAAYTFNCAQRAHAQFMEHAPHTMMYMLVAGLHYPNATIALGLGWLMSRMLYMYGYIYSDRPHGGGRYFGTSFYIAQAGLWGLVGMTALNIIS